MKIKLTPEQKANRDRIASKLAEARDEVSKHVEDYNKNLTILNDKMDEEFEKYNLLLIEARHFIDGLVEEQEKRLKTFSPGDEGIPDVSIIIDDLEDIYLSDFDVAFPQALDVEDPDHSSIIAEIGDRDD